MWFGWLCTFDCVFCDNVTKFWERCVEFCPYDDAFCEGNCLFIWVGTGAGWGPLGVDVIAGFSAVLMLFGKPGKRKKKLETMVE